MMARRADYETAPERALDRAEERMRADAARISSDPDWIYFVASWTWCLGVLMVFSIGTIVGMYSGLAMAQLLELSDGARKALVISAMFLTPILLMKLMLARRLLRDHAKAASGNEVDTAS